MTAGVLRQSLQRPDFDMRLVTSEGSIGENMIRLRRRKHAAPLTLSSTRSRTICTGDCAIITQFRWGASLRRALIVTSESGGVT